MVPVARLQLDVVLKAGARPAKLLKEFSGSVAAQVNTPPEPLLTLHNVLKAAGTEAKGTDGGVLRLNQIEKLPGGDYQLRVFIENASGPNPLGMALNVGVIQMQQIQIHVGGGFANGQVHAPGLPELIDAKGNKFQPVQIPSRGMRINNSVVSEDITVVYRGGAGHGDPDHLIVYGSRQAHVTVPFVFRDVPLE